MIYKIKKSQLTEITKRLKIGQTKHHDNAFSFGVNRGKAWAIKYASYDELARIHWFRYRLCDYRSLSILKEQCPKPDCCGQLVDYRLMDYGWSDCLFRLIYGSSYQKRNIARYTIETQLKQMVVR